MKISQTGPEFCRLSPQEGFILINVPVSIEPVTTDSKDLMLVSGMGSYEGRPQHWSAQGVDEIALPFRLPSDVFRQGEQVRLAVFRAKGAVGPELLWEQYYEASWVNGLPHINPVAYSSHGKSLKDGHHVPPQA